MILDNWRKWLDVDTNERQSVDGLHLTGCAPRDDRCGDHAPVAEDKLGIIPRSEWPGLVKVNKTLSVYLGGIKNQGQEGACASNGATSSHEIIFNQSLGRQNWVELSAMSVYQWVGRSASSGSTIRSNLEQLRNVGALPRDTQRNIEMLKAAKLSGFDVDPAHVHPATGWGQRFPDGWKRTAQHFRIAEYWDIRTFDGMVTCLLRGFPVLYGRQGHAICAVNVEYRDGMWLIKYVNSWGTNWGGDDGTWKSGFGYDSERILRPALPQYGAWCCRANVLPDFVLAA